MKYFVTSDIHSFFDEFKSAIDVAGFKPRNKDHTLIVCGDIFDRGQKTVEVFNYLKKIPRKRRILVRGNHEDLFEELLEKSFPDKHDFSNGTVRTFCAIANVKEWYIDPHFWYKQAVLDSKDGMGGGVDYSRKPYEWWQEVIKRVQDSEICKFIKDKKNWVNYYEVNKYIFVHSFIPTKVKPEFKQFLYCGFPLDLSSHYNYDPNWRKNNYWLDARWGCPWAQYRAGLFEPEAKKGKILVCGHWHAADFHKVFEKAKEENNELYYGSNLVALDACTVVSHFCNLIVIDEKFDAYDKLGWKLKFDFEAPF